MQTQQLLIPVMRHYEGCLLIVPADKQRREAMLRNQSKLEARVK
jgi:hypothetical protein